MPNRIHRARDANKDQTYFIWQIKKEQLDHILFPVGEFQDKSAVRDYAQSKGLITSNKPDSQGLCFVGQTSLRQMLTQVLGTKVGSIVAVMSLQELDSIGISISQSSTRISLPTEVNGVIRYQVVLGQHDGAFLFTIGQRQNLGLSNGPWFVSAIDIKQNLVFVCHNNWAQELDCSEIIVNDCNWHIDLQSQIKNQTETRIENSKINLNCYCQVRYRSEAVACQVELLDDLGTSVKVIFGQPVRAIAVGQSAVFYDDNGMLLGGGFINSKTQSITTNQ